MQSFTHKNSHDRVSAGKEVLCNARLSGAAANPECTLLQWYRHRSNLSAVDGFDTGLRLEICSKHLKQALVQVNPSPRFCDASLFIYWGYLWWSCSFVEVGVVAYAFNRMHQRLFPAVLGSKQVNKRHITYINYLRWNIRTVLPTALVNQIICWKVLSTFAHDKSLYAQTQVSCRGSFRHQWISP